MATIKEALTIASNEALSDEQRSRLMSIIADGMGKSPIAADVQDVIALSYIAGVYKDSAAGTTARRILIDAVLRDPDIAAQSVERLATQLKSLSADDPRFEDLKTQSLKAVDGLSDTMAAREAMLESPVAPHSPAKWMMAHMGISTKKLNS